MTKAEIQEQAVRQKWLISPVNVAPDLLEDPQLLERGFWVDVDGDKQPGPFARLGRTPIAYDRPAPTLGQDQGLVDDLERRPSPPTVASPSPRTRAFEGLKVADFSWIAAGAADRQGPGEPRRDGAPRRDRVAHRHPALAAAPHRRPGPASGHTAANMNQSKLGIAIDFTKPEGLAVAHRMVEWADVVVENFTPGTAERLGLGYEQLREINPEIVMIYTCMRGQTGPERKHTGFGLHGAALGGFTGITGWSDRKPSSPWGAYTDFISPRYALAALGAALHHRDRTGEGQVIDVSQIEAAIHHLAPTILDTQRTGRVLERAGLDSEWGCPHGVYRTRETERFVAIEARTPDQWRALQAEVPGLAKLGGDALDGVDARLARRKEIDDVLSAFAAEQACFEWAERLRAAGVPAYVPLRATDFTKDPQLVARDFYVELEHGGFGRSLFDGAVTTFSRTPPAPDPRGPLIGEHTFEVMKDVLGYSDDEISEIAAAGALS